MAGFIAKQPNGKYCRFSSIVDTVTDWDMTEDEYIEMCAERARMEAREVLKGWVQPFDLVLKRFRPLNQTAEEFKEEVRKYTGYTGDFPEYPPVYCGE